MQMTIGVGRALALSVALSIWSGVLAASGIPDLNLRIHPAVADEHGAVPFVDIYIQAKGILAEKGAALISIPKVVATTTTNADQITDLGVDDSFGRVPLTIEDTASGPDDQLREWHAGRQVHGTVQIRYRVALEADKPLSGGPMFEMRTGDGSFSGAGVSFLILPADKTPRVVHISWNAASGAPTNKGVSSLGTGDVTGPEPLTSTQIGNTYFMGGNLGVYQGKNAQFFGAWTGKPQFSVDDVMQWTETLHTFYVKFFASGTSKFGVFTRANPFNPGSGVGLTDSFAFTYGPTTTVEGTRLVLAHEMVHTQMPSLEDGSGDADSLTTAWFSEGIAVHYEHVLPLRAGLIDRKTFLQDLNSVAAQYYTNAERNSSNARAAAGFWLDARLRLLPYNRGALYFAQLDAAIRSHSGGKRSLDDLVQAILARHRSGKPVDEAFWRRLVVAEAGPAGLADYEAMLDGKLVLPPSDAFGPCFQRVVRKTRPFDMGFTASSFQRPASVTKLKPGSEAENAGLREGDIVTKGRPGDRILMDPNATLTLKITRGEQTFDATYLPRGKPTDTYQWEEVHSPQCRTVVVK